MADAETLIDLLEGEELPDSTGAFQLDDGTIIYRKQDSGFPQWLYVKSKGKKVDVKMPDGIKIGPETAIKTNGNAIYIAENKKIYKAVLSTPDAFTVSLVREQNEHETIEYGVCTGLRDGRKIVYQMWDSSERDGILVDVDEKKDSAKLIGMIRGNIFYARRKGCYGSNLKIHKWSEKEFVIESPPNYYDALTDSGSTSFIYTTYGSQLYTLNIDTMEFLPTLNCSVNISIVGVFNGKITVRRYDNSTGKMCLNYAQLPDGYFDFNESVDNNHAIEENIDESTHLPSDVSLASDSFDHLIDQCCCSICTEMFDSTKFVPRILDCGHTFCEVCIKSICSNNAINCPNCSIDTTVTDGKDLLKNFSMISLSEEVMKSRKNPKIACNGCHIKFLSSSLCMCIKENCDMFEKLLCFNCAIGGGHGGHVVQYEEKIKKTNEICSQLDEVKKGVITKSSKLVKISNAMEKKLMETNIPANVINQIHSLSSDQEADEYMEIVRDLAKSITDKCKILADAFEHTLNAANFLEFHDEDEGDGEEKIDA